MADIFQVPATLYKVESMSHWWRIIFDTQERVPSEQMAVVLGWLHKLGWVNFAVRQIESGDIIDLPEIIPEDKRTPSQKLRAVLWLLWKKNNEGMKDFPVYYEAKMDRITNAYKEKLT